MNMTFLDGHAKFANTKWLRSDKGKYAINPMCWQLADTTSWSTAACVPTQPAP